MSLFSEQTAMILANLASVNGSLHVVKGKTLQSLSESRTICAITDNPPEFEDAPDEFGIYDLGGFLNLISLIPEGKATFGDKSISVSDSSRSISYRYSSLDVVKSRPPRELPTPTPLGALTISAERFSEIRKAAGALKAKSIRLVSEEGSDLVKVLIANADDDANVFTILVDSNFDKAVSMDIGIRLAELRILAGEYKIELSKIGENVVLNLIHSSLPIRYFFATEKDSTLDA